MKILGNLLLIGVISEISVFVPARAATNMVPAASVAVMASSNLMPTNAVFNSSGTYTLPTLPTNVLYYFEFSTADGSAWELDSDDLNVAIDPSYGSKVIVNFVGASAPYTLNGGTPGVTVHTRFFAISTNVISGNLVGSFTGKISGGSTVQDQSLSANVQLRSEQGLFVSTNNTLAGLSVYGNSIIPSTDNGSLVNLHKFGRFGYADINFFVDNQNTNFSILDPRRYNLHFAIGSGVELATNNFPYNENYFECYGQHSVWWVQYPRIFGGCNGTNGDFVWYQDKSSDADESKKMFDISRSAGVVSNLCQVFVQSNLTTAASVIFTPGTKPTAAQLGVNGVGYWNSNGTLYALGSANGSSYSFINKIAP